MTNYFPLHVPMQVTPITVPLPQYQHPRYYTDARNSRYSPLFMPVKDTSARFLCPATIILAITDATNYFPLHVAYLKDTSERFL